MRFEKLTTSATMTMIATAPPARASQSPTRPFFAGGEAGQGACPLGWPGAKPWGCPEGGGGGWGGLPGVAWGLPGGAWPG